MFAMQKTPSIPLVSDARASRYSPVDETRGVAVVDMGSRGQLGGSVWMLLLNGVQIPFETSDFLNVDPLAGEVPLPRFKKFGSLSYGGWYLGDLRYEFANDPERRAAQQLAIEGVLFDGSRLGQLERGVLTTGRSVTDLDATYAPGNVAQFEFEGRIYGLEDFGYEDIGRVVR